MSSARNSYGPAYTIEDDEARIKKQHDAIRDYMLRREEGVWRTLEEVSLALGYPEASVSAQLRHLRKPEHGGYLVDKRRRVGHRGLWEYRVRAAPLKQDELFPVEQAAMKGH